MQKELKPLPLGISDIGVLIKNNFLYVDKTKLVYEMIKLPSKFFLSRPRRFGKSMLVSTFNEIFRGNRELFKDQWIYNSDWNWQEYPIIRLDFNVAMDTDLADYIKKSLKLVAINYDVFNVDDFETYSYEEYFKELIINLSKKYNNSQVVVLIDEYDKPILDAIDDIKLAGHKRDILKGFYTVMKGLDEYIRFIFFTGVTRFTKVGVFSGLNNLDDISMDNKYASICGITDQELKYYFTNYINEFAGELQITPQKCLEEIKEWYNGFCFCNSGVSVYNPYSMVILFQKRQFNNYWFSSGNASFIIKLMKQQTNLEIFRFDNYLIEASQFDTFDIEQLNLTALLFQAGYLTIKAYDTDSDIYTLSYPNKEINKSFKSNILELFGKSPNTGSGGIIAIYQALLNNDIDDCIDALKQIFLNIDYDIKISNEKHYQNIFYLIFQLLGYKIQTEYKTNRGRIDAIIQTNDHIYIFEFKIDKSANEALEQIKDKSYYERFLVSGKAIFLIGVNFSSKTRNIDDYIVQCL